MFSLESLEWESAFFDARMGAISSGDDPGVTSRTERAAVLAQQMKLVVEQATRQAYQHLAVRVRAEDVELVWAAEACGFRLVDAAVDLTRALDAGDIAQSGSKSKLTFRSGATRDIPELQQMTEGAFSLTRFATDPFFTPEQTTRFYRTWVANLFEGLADEVIVAEVDGEPSGFISCVCKDQVGRIPLVATRRDRQRQGIGSDLLAAALRWFDSRTRVVHVKTQTANYPALALYQRAGFFITSAELNFSRSGAAEQASAGSA